MALQVDWVGTDRVIESSNDYIISAIPVTLIDVIWPQVEPLLLKPIGLSHGECDIVSVYNSIRKGNVLLLTVSLKSKIVAVLTVDVRTFESGLRTLYIPLIGGTDMPKWFDRAMYIIEAIAIDHNCTELRGIAVRKGWLRILEKDGWEEVSVTVKKDIRGI